MELKVTIGFIVKVDHNGKQSDTGTQSHSNAKSQWDRINTMKHSHRGTQSDNGRKMYNITQSHNGTKNHNGTQIHNGTIRLV